MGGFLQLESIEGYERDKGMSMCIHLGALRGVWDGERVGFDCLRWDYRTSLSAWLLLSDSKAYEIIQAMLWSGKLVKRTSGSSSWLYGR